jgi:hypothetical protein
MSSEWIAAYSQLETKYDLLQQELDYVHKHADVCIEQWPEEPDVTDDFPVRKYESTEDAWNKEFKEAHNKTYKEVIQDMFSIKSGGLLESTYSIFDKNESKYKKEIEEYMKKYPLKYYKQRALIGSKK